MSPFVAVPDDGPDEAWADLSALVGSGEDVAAVDQPNIGEGWYAADAIEGVQLVATPSLEPVPDDSLRPLGREHVPAMVALVELTHPGPFQERTVDFGGYVGVFDDDQLVAMAGQRLHVGPFREISAVCTHPDFAGRGETPIMHAAATNARAIGLYESLGFAVARQIEFTLVRRTGG